MKIIRDILLTAIMIAGLLMTLIYASIQESFRITPPTSAEIAENPELARYLP